MKSSDLKYENLYENFKNLFPKYKEFLECKEQENLVDSDDGGHIPFAFCVVPLIHKFVDEDKKEELVKAFDYFELMASSEDHLVGEVVAFTLLENFCTDEVYYPKLKPYFEKNTEDLIPLVAHYVTVVKC